MKLNYIIVSLLCIINITTVYAQKKDPYVTDFFAKGGVLSGPISGTFVQKFRKKIIPPPYIEDFKEANYKNGFNRKGSILIVDSTGTVFNEGLLYGIFNGRMHISSYVNIANGNVILEYERQYSLLKSGSKNDKDVLTLSVGYYTGDFHGEFKILNQDSLPLYKTNFKHGRGYWKDYYYLPDSDSYQLKEEGKVKHNYKNGKWKYYTESGALDWEVMYTIKDSVDVRFPHCLLNKKEPCLKKEELIEEEEYKNSVYYKNR